MSLAMMGALAVRVLTQLRRDHRTLALILLVPCLLMTLLWWMFRDLPGDTFSRLGPGLLALFPFTVMFLVTSVTTLRERTSGTLERLLAMPLGKVDFIAGNALAFGLLAMVQATLAMGLSILVLGLTISGSVAMLALIAVLDAVLGAALGLFVSAFAKTEFQAVQFLPALVIPQMLLCGLIMARDQLPSVLHAISSVLPLSYAVDAMNAVSTGSSAGPIWRDVAIVATFAFTLLALGALTLNRRTP